MTPRPADRRIGYPDPPDRRLAGDIRDTRVVAAADARRREAQPMGVRPTTRRVPGFLVDGGGGHTIQVTAAINPMQ